MQPDRMDIVEFMLEEVSLVDVPANGEAKVALFKRASQPSGAPDDNLGTKETPMTDKLTPEQERRMDVLIAKGVKQEAAEQIVKSGLIDVVEKLMERTEAAEKLCEKSMDETSDLMETIKAAGGEIVDGKLVVKQAEEPEYIDIDGDKVLKSAVPAPLLRKLEKQETDLEELKKVREVEKLEKRAQSEIPNLGGSDRAKGLLLKAVDGMQEADAADLTRALKAADFAVSKMFDEAGVAGGDEEGTATAELRKMAEKHAKDHDVPYETAFSEVVKTRSGKKLLAESRAEQ